MIALIFDAHLDNFHYRGGEINNGINERAKAVLKTIEKAIEEPGYKDVSSIIFGGDFFNVNMPPPPLYAESVKLVKKWIGDKKKVIFLLGNHEIVNKEIPSVNALMPFEKLGAAVITKPTALDVDEVRIGFQPYGYDLNPELIGKCDYFVAHMGISMQEVFLEQPSYITPSAAKLFQKKIKCRMGFYGHYHESGSPTEEVEMVGALVPRSFSDAGPNYGRVIYIDGEDVMEEKFASIRFLEVREPEDLKLVEVMEAEGNYVYVRAGKKFTKKLEKMGNVEMEEIEDGVASMVPVKKELPSDVLSAINEYIDEQDYKAGMKKQMKKEVKRLWVW